MLVANSGIMQSPAARTPLVLQLDDKTTDIDHVDVDMDGPGPPWEEACRIPLCALHRVLQGVAIATKSSADDVERVKRQITLMQHTLSEDTLSPHSDGSESIASYATSSTYSLHECYREMLQNVSDKRTQHLCVLTISVAYLRQHSRDRQDQPIPPTTMNEIWSKIHSVLADSTLSLPLCNAVRSAQDFLSIALCSLIEDGNIDELFRLHVWLPDGRRGKPDFKVHSHQPFAQSYVLAGSGTDIPYQVHSTTDASHATHAEYKLTWSDGLKTDTNYKPHQTSSAIANTGRLVHAIPSQPVSHARDTTYTVGHAHYHTTIVSPNTFHATFFFFDSSRGFEKYAPVLGPVTGTTFVQHRDPAGITACALADMVQAARGWEVLMERARECLRTGELEGAVDFVGQALRCKGLPDSDEYRKAALRELEEIERRIAGVEA